MFPHARGAPATISDHAGHMTQPPLTDVSRRFPHVCCCVCKISWSCALLSKCIVFSLVGVGLVLSLSPPSRSLSSLCSLVCFFFFQRDQWLDFLLWHYQCWGAQKFDWCYSVFTRHRNYQVTHRIASARRSVDKMSAEDVVFTGWLIKSPPEKKLKRYVSTEMRSDAWVGDIRDGSLGCFLIGCCCTSYCTKCVQTARSSTVHHCHACSKKSHFLF